MNDPALIADLVRAGVTPELIARIVDEITGAYASVSGGNRVDAAADRRRAWDREYRANRRKNPPESTRHPPDTNSALSILESKKERTEVKKERSRGSKIPPDWRPNVGHIAAGKQLGFSEPQIHEQAEDMRLWAQSNEHRAVARKSDWDMTFLGWLRRNKPNGAHVNGHKSASSKSLASAGDDLIARAEELERTFDLGPGDYARTGGEGGEGAHGPVPEPARR